MKNLFIVTLVSFVASVASARSPMPREVALMSAKLHYVVPTKPQQGPKALNLTIYQNQASNKPTSFILVQEDKKFCVAAPCPQTRNIEFRITNISASFHRGDSVRYEAVEVLRNIPPHVRIAPMRLNVTESSMELVGPGRSGFFHRTTWEVEVETFGQETKFYTGQPKAVRRLF